MRNLLVSSLLLFASSYLPAQQHESSPFYQEAEGVLALALHRWIAHANGITAEISIVPPPPPFAPWNEGMIVDGPKEHEVFHWWLEDMYSKVYFGYDLLLEPVPRNPAD